MALFSACDTHPFLQAGKGKGGDEPAGPPLVLVPNGKEQRMRDEEKMKVGVARASTGGLFYSHGGELQNKHILCETSMIFSGQFMQNFAEFRPNSANLREFHFSAKFR